MLNRNDIPAFTLPQNVTVAEPIQGKLKNGIPYSLVSGGTQDVVKIDFVFEAGVVHAPKALVASFTNKLLQEGTQTMTAYELAEKMDFYGAYLGESASYHYGQITLYCLTKHLSSLLPLIEDMLKHPSFVKEEFDLLLSKKRQEFIVDSEKVKVLASRKAQEVLFENHMYGRITKPYHFDEIALDDVKLFHQKQYVSNKCSIIISGQPGDDFESVLNQFFGGDDWGNAGGVTEAIDLPKSSKEKNHFVHVDGALQSAIKIVRPMINKAHPDFLPLQLLNTILGGYFGSRLMNNLREEKGLTYGIGSSIVSFLNAGMMSISTEVVADKRDLAVKEIFAELLRLQDEKVDEDELRRVKNYVLGELLRSLDGPFALSDAYRGLMGFDFGMDYIINRRKDIGKQ